MSASASTGGWGRLGPALVLCVGIVLSSPAQAGLFTCLNERQEVVFTNAPKGDGCRAVMEIAWEDLPRTASLDTSRERLGGRHPFFGGNSGKWLEQKRRGARRNDGAYDHLIREAARRHRLDPLLIKAVIKAESDFDPAARSSAGARGLMQLMPGTARDMRVANVHDPGQNIDGGSRYLRTLLDTFAQDLTLSLAAYNAGPERVLEARVVPPIAETQRYVRKVMQLYRGYSVTGGGEGGQRHTLRLHRLVTEN